MSRQDVADKVEVNVQTVGFIERGDYSPSLELAFKLARLFDVGIETLFSPSPFPSLFNSNKEKEDENEIK